MSPRDHQRTWRALELFLEASVLPAEELDAFLDRNCNSDDELRGEVRELIGMGNPSKVVTTAGAEDPHESASLKLLDRLSQHRQGGARYEILGKLAHGGQGSVLLVRDTDLCRTMAMKVLLRRADRSAPGEPLDPVSLGRFIEEAQVTGQLDHPGIVPVHELSVDEEGQVYFTMRLVRGRELREVIDYVHSGVEGWNLPKALGVLLKVCEALAYAHSKGVIHRDLKPSNIMVGRFGEVYVMDWGLAHVLGERDRKDIRIRPPETKRLSVHSFLEGESDSPPDSPLSTMDGFVIGTPAYMPPEQAAGHLAEVGPRADVYSLGAILYHLLGGRIPYTEPGTRVSSRTVLAMVLCGPPKPLHEFRPDTPAELEAICERAMARDPADRYAGVGAMAQDLESYLEGRVVRAHERGAWAEARKWVQRNKALAASIAVALLLAISGLGAVNHVQAKGLNAAQIERRRANSKAEEAERMAEDLLSLSALQILEDLARRADEMWPPHPETIPAYQMWLADAEGVVSRLEEVREQFHALGERATPLSEAELDEARRNDPRHEELERVKAKATTLRRARQTRLGLLDPEPFELDEARVPQDMDELLRVARPLVEPERALYGRETEGLALARRAMDQASDPCSIVRAAEVLANALFALGHDVEALAEARAAVREASDECAADAESFLTDMEGRVARADQDEGAGLIAEADAEVAALQAAIDRGIDMEFETTQDRWWYYALAKLIDEIELITDPHAGLLAEGAIHPSLSWSVPKRLRLAEDLRASCSPGAEFHTRWREAITEIHEHEAYGGLELEVQMGLVPLGRDPESGLWEFWHVASGEEPDRDRNGKLVMRDSTGLVFVLIPAGEFLMGAQPGDPMSPNYDPEANLFLEGPVHRVRLSAFFLSKFEMTQGQWKRLSGWNRSELGPDGEWRSTWSESHVPATLKNPVTDVSWDECMQTLQRFGLTLPSEAQWEFGCRAKSQTPWWPGNEPQMLAGAANLADVYARDHGAPELEEWIEEWLHDGYTYHAAVGSFAPNPIGLHDVHGNVWEWCLDGFIADFYLQIPRRDPTAAPEDSATRVIRGGSFFTAATDARSTHREEGSPSLVGFTLGVRPARVLPR